MKNYVMLVQLINPDIDWKVSLTLFTYPSEWFFPITQDPLVQLISTFTTFVLIGVLIMLTNYAITLAWLTRPAFKQIKFTFHQTLWSKRLSRYEAMVFISIFILMIVSTSISQLDFTIICQFGLLFCIFSMLTRDILEQRWAWQARHDSTVLASLTTLERRQWSYFNSWSIISTGLTMLIQVTVFSLLISFLPALTSITKNATP